jgi:hypothetical protein
MATTSRTSSSSHTPGPWRDETVTTAQAARMRGPEPQDALVLGDDMTVIGVLYDFANRAPSNARLVAAAPELLQLAHRVADFFYETNAPIGEAARRLIAKAEGR